ncbi:hypothetical protein [Methanococcoides methylutens]|uniref:Uncharacterized protein n=1 Tax=Methanococcoides methylutens MM1 TaxID=1434104 RepID=A0A0E3SRN5_METMT|nr:hypothetical protein [Methanococcoides methylutens]AKB85008.1 hypothetical protein MCMEM_0955 [Methanococcoides methylutens MM1]
MDQFKESLEGNLSAARQKIKTPIGHALRMETDFSVRTPVGILKGKAGDYVIKHKSGMISIIGSYVFNKKYEILR